ncbi:response regulator transcription factor [Rhizobium sp. EC-SD404]|uniref:response regulator n=1 Tax=Rhizobium sp. EC-SD404 TaxID=2038389 RepID=UPI0012523D1C|nr:response regulator transcription factor [Rhizobium sp. EC-SD404]VVT08464.1 DNA-binding response regulator [Rhizobium sp. EC-SD404]
MSAISIAFVDDHPILLEGIVSVFSRSSELNIVAKGYTTEDALKIAETHSPDILVVDLSMPGDIFDAISKISGRQTNTKVIAFTAATGIDQAVRALDSGASGYVLKGSTADDLLNAVHAVRSGETFITQGFAGKVIAALRNASLRKAAVQAIKLSIREEQIVRLLMRGRTNREIAEQLHISEKTVKHYMTVLMQKLNVRNRLEVVIAAQKLGDVVDPGAAAASAHQSYLN